MAKYLLAPPTAGYYKRRRGLMDDLKIGKLSLLDNSLHDVLCQLADPESGILWTNAADLAWRSNSSRKLVQKHLRRLEARGYIKRFSFPRSKKHYPILINSFECTMGAHIGMRLNALETSDWRVPVYSRRIQSGIQSERQSGGHKRPRI